MNDQIPKPLIIIISLLQGLVLTLLYQSVEPNVWPASEPVWMISLTTLAIALPLLTLLCITKTNIKQTLKFVLPFSIVLSLLGAYVGFQQEPKEFINNHFALGIFFFTALLASFKALMYIQQYINNQKISYNSLFQLSWRNFVIFVECWIFIGIFWGILNLGAGLFAVLEINFFKELLNESWFVIPVQTVAFGFAIIVFRNIIHTADNIASILQTLIKFLLPALTIVSLSFLITLPFAGFNTLWKTGSGSLLVMCLQALLLFFVNAVYQDESKQRSYNLYLHRLVLIGVALLPIYSFISAYGIWLRIDQYGLTVERCWAVLVWVLLTCFSFGYLAGILKKRDAWLEIRSFVNIRMGIVVLGFMLLVNTPILNFQSISANNQLARLHDGDISVEDFDYAYFKSMLGRQGYLGLQDLKEKLQDVSPDSVAIIDRLYAKNQDAGNIDSRSEFEEMLTYWPNKDSFSEDLITVLFEEETQHPWLNFREFSYYLLAQDLNDDGVAEFIVIKESNYSFTAKMWLKNNNGWHSIHMATRYPDNHSSIKSRIELGDVQAVQPNWNLLKVGDLELQVGLD